MRLSIHTASLKACEPLAIMPDQVFIDRGGFFAVLFFRILQMGDGGFDHNAPGFPFLAVRPGGSGETKRADKRRKRDALQYERDENNAEREKNN